MTPHPEQNKGATTGQVAKPTRHTLPQNATGLTMQQQRGLHAICTCGSIAEAARAAAVDRGTIHRWLRLPEFSSELRRMQIDILQDAAKLYGGLLLESLQVLSDRLRSKDEKISLIASGQFFNCVRDLLDASEMHRFVSEIEKRVASCEKEPSPVPVVAPQARHVVRSTVALPEEDRPAPRPKPAPLVTASQRRVQPMQVRCRALAREIEE